MPTFAIDNFGIKKSKFYGCGKCLNSCPLNLISEYEYNLSKNDLGSTLQKIKLNTVEMHTEVNRLDSFTKVVSILKSSGMKLDKITIICGLNQSIKKS